jgi:hypothetical protein
VDPILSEIVKTIPVIGLLLYVFKGEREERQQLTRQFLETLETLAANSLKAITEQTLTNRSITEHVAQLQVVQTAEHREIIQDLRALGKTITAQPRDKLLIPPLATQPAT